MGMRKLINATLRLAPFSPPLITLVNDSNQEYSDSRPQSYRCSTFYISYRELFLEDSR